MYGAPTHGAAVYGGFNMPSLDHPPVSRGRNRERPQRGHTRELQRQSRASTRPATGRTTER